MFVMTLPLCILVSHTAVSETSFRPKTAVAGSILTVARVPQMSTLNFDRYSEEALLVLWFTRKAVSEVGGATITPEHLLIGLLRSNPESVGRFLVPPDSPDTIIAEVADAIGRRDKIPSATADLPLAEDTDRILRGAIQESEDDMKKFVLPEHILLALLNESASVPAAILRTHAVSTEKVRSYLQGQR